MTIEKERGRAGPSQPDGPDATLRSVIQELRWGEIRQERPAPPDAMFATTGRRLYVTGDIDGGFRPRSNPYDLYNFGGPLPGDPLANRLQGVWSQPVKALDGYTIVIESENDRWPLTEAERFTQTFADVRFDYRRGALSATRIDFVPQNLPALFTTLRLRNDGPERADVRIAFIVRFDLRDAWYTTLAGQPNEGETVCVDGGRLLARACQLPDAWAVAVGGAETPTEAEVHAGDDGHSIGVLRYDARLEPGTERTWTIATVVEIESGAVVALRNLEEWLPQRQSLSIGKQALYGNLLAAGPRLRSPDAQFDAAFDIARADLQMLETETRTLGRFFFAGLPAFPFWFSADGGYSTSGLLAAGFASATMNHLRIGAGFDATGGVAHQRSPSGAITHRGTVPETPLWVMALWDAFRWTGDRAFLKAVYPSAVAGLLGHTLGDCDRDGFPQGPGLIEREDMGSKKLDSAAYTWAALDALACMADAMGDPKTAARSRGLAAAEADGFDAAWWDRTEGTYAISLDESDNAQRHVRHWGVIVPLEVGLATPGHAETTLATVQAMYVNDWGVAHTVGEDERVWSLPTAILSRAAYRYGQEDLGFRMLRQVSLMLDHGSIGLYHELIPDGLGFLQLWSAAAFLRGVVEDLIGVRVRADLHTVTVTPHLPAEWPTAALESLSFGEHTINVLATPDSMTVSHLSGPVPLTAAWRGRDGLDRSATVGVGDCIRW